MKRLIIITFILVGQNLLFAQYRERTGEMYLGIAASFGHNYMGSSFTGEPQFKPGGAVGMQLQYFHTEQVFLTSGLHYSFKGGKYKTMVLNGNQWAQEFYNQNLEYIELPIGIGYNLKQYKFESSPFISVSVYYAFLTKAYEKAVSGSNREKFIDNDYGFNFRMGITDQNISLSFNYKLGITNLTIEQEEGKLINHRPEIGLVYVLR